MIQHAKEEYFVSFGKELCDPNIGQKRYWSILHKFLGKRKIPQIPPLYNNDSFVTNFSDKAELFNNFFAKQCTLINTPSILPPFSYVTHQRLNTVDFVPEKLASIIKSLNPNKAHGWDEISVRMIQISGDALIPPLIIIFNNIITTGIYPTSWKKANIVPIHKKEDKTLVKNYRPISLLPILGKMFEKCIYDSIYGYFEDNNLFTSCQSGFRKGDSCISQLMSIAHEIFLNFDTNPTTDTRGVLFGYF